MAKTRKTTAWSKTPAKRKAPSKAKAPAKASAIKTARTAKPKVAPPAPPAPAAAPKRTAREILIGACSRAEGATAKELFAGTGWKYASWSHQLQLAAKATGWVSTIRKVDGATRYFLTEPGQEAPA